MTAPSKEASSFSEVWTFAEEEEFGLGMMHTPYTVLYCTVENTVVMPFVEKKKIGVSLNGMGLQGPRKVSRYRDVVIIS